MYDVAREAGVSGAAVSYALSGAPGVSDEVRERILRVAGELGFRPSRLARELQSGTTKTIGLLLADIANPVYSELPAAWLPRPPRKGMRSSSPTSASTGRDRPRLHWPRSTERAAD